MELSLKEKVGLLSIIPLVVIIILSYFLISQSYSDLKKTDSLEKAILLSTKLSAVVHELQKERGRSAGFVGSGGKAFKQELQEQRKLTDKKIAELKTVVNTVFLSALPQSSRKTVENVLTDLNEIVEIRMKVDKLEIPLNSVVSFYTSLNEKLINAIGGIAKTTFNAEITRELFAYVDFLYAKEKMGLERAILSVAFANDKFTKELYERFITLTAQQKAFLKSFYLEAPQTVVQYYEKIVEKSPATAEVKRMEELADSSPFEGGFGVSPDYWFKAITDKINLMKKVEDFISSDLVNKVKFVRSEAKSRLTTTLFISIISIVVILGASLTALRKG